MAVKTGKPYNTYYKNDLHIDQASNTGCDTSTRLVQTDGTNTAISLSDDVLLVKPQSDDTVATLVTQSNSGDNILAVDTTNKKVLVGASQVAANTQYKEMGIYDFLPSNASNFYPLVATNMLTSNGATAIVYDQDWGTSSPTAMDISDLTDRSHAVAVYWYIEDNITIDSARILSETDSSAQLLIHVNSFTVNEILGDLSAGGTHVIGGPVASGATIPKYTSLTVTVPDIDAGKVVVGFFRYSTTARISISLNIKYHIR